MVSKAFALLILHHASDEGCGRQKGADGRAGSSAIASTMEEGSTGSLRAVGARKHRGRQGGKGQLWLVGAVDGGGNSTRKASGAETL